MEPVELDLRDLRDLLVAQAQLDLRVEPARQVQLALQAQLVEPDRLDLRDLPV